MSKKKVMWLFGLSGAGKSTIASALSKRLKEQKKQEIEEIFKVAVVSVDTRIQKGRTQRVGIRRTVRKLTPTKKAVVTLKDGQKIDIFDLGV